MKRDFVEYLTEQDGPIVECINRSISSRRGKASVDPVAWSRHTLRIRWDRTPSCKFKPYVPVRHKFIFSGDTEDLGSLA